MARATNKTKDSLPTAEARRRLPGLVKEMGAKKKPSADLLENAVDIGPHRRGGAVLVPEIDVIESERERDELRRHVQELEDDLDDLGLVILAEERLASASGPRLSAQEFLAELGMEKFSARLSQS